MKLRVQILFHQDDYVEVGQTFGFTFRVNGEAVAFPDGVVTIQKTFGTVASRDVIVVGENNNATRQNVLANLQTYNIPVNPAYVIAYSTAGRSVFADIEFDGFITVTDVQALVGYYSIYVQDRVAVAPFEVDFFDIEIIDTHTNERLLLVEHSRADSLKLSWDMGDDIYNPFMASKLSFSMEVPDVRDGAFLHLLTGDETRYLVRLTNNNGIDTNDTILLWQGCILPDLYSEPYKNGVFFVEFTATDMVASLKGKTFDPWFYYNTFNVPELLGYILEKTGLKQEMYVKPSLVNVGNPSFEWQRLNMSLRPYYNGKKYTDLYKILEDILQSQGFVMFSYRGKWFLEGITRRQEQSGECEVYHYDGYFKEKLTLSHDVYAVAFNEDPVLTADTPFKRVNVKFDTNDTESLFTDDVVLADYKSTRYRYDVNLHDVINGYVTDFQNNWIKHNAPMLSWSGNELPYLFYKHTYGTYGNITEAGALNNYLECLQRPYAQAGRRLKLQIECKFSYRHFIESQETFMENLDAGAYDSVLVFQLLVNDVEYLSNRPSHPTSRRLRFVKTPTIDSGNYTADFKLEYEFVMPEDGYFTFRFLCAIGALSGFAESGSYAIYPRVLKIVKTDTVDDKGGVFAARDIEYTQELDYDVPITSTSDTSIRNNFGIERRTGARYYEVPAANPISFLDTHYKSIEVNVDGFTWENWINQTIPYTFNVSASLELTRYDSTDFFRYLAFALPEGKKSVFLVQADGTKVHYFSLYAKTINGVYTFVAYRGNIPYFNGLPDIPKDYVPLPEIGTGRLFVMLSLFDDGEIIQHRDTWKIYGFDNETADTYLNTVAKMCHAVRSSVGFSLEGTALKLLFPTQLVQFRYLEQDKIFVPTRFELDLFKGKTRLNAKEAQLQNVTDITYE